MQLKQFGSPDLSSVVESRGGKMVIGDLADIRQIPNSRIHKRERVLSKV